MSTAPTTDKKTMIKWLCVLLFPALIFLIPTNDTFTWSIKLFFIITLLAILLFATEVINQTAVALLLPIAYIVFQLAPNATVLSPWTGSTPWMMIGGLILANVLQSIGLLKRIAYKCIIITGGSYKGIIWGIALAGLILNVLIPAQATIPLAAFAYGVCMAMGLKKGKAAAGIMLGAGFAALLPNYFILNPNALIVYGVGENVTGPSGVSWTNFLFHNAPTLIFYIVMFWVVTKVFKPETHINGKEWFANEYANLGPLSKAEKKGLVICVLLFIGLLTQSIHGIDVAWIFAFMPMLAYMPGFKIGTADDIRNSNFPFIIFVASCMCIGSVGTYLGVGEMIGDALMPYLEGKSFTFVLFAIWALCVLANFILTPLAIGTTFTAPLTNIALNLGINPEVIWMTILHGYDQILLPYEFPLYMLFFSFNLVHLSDFMKIFSLKMIVNLVFFLTLLVPYWKIIGFLYI